MEDLRALSPGLELDGRYQIVKLLGSGGFGLTYLAYHVDLDVQVAIKEFFPSGQAVRNQSGSISVMHNQKMEEFQWGLDRFRREARELRKLNHPNIVKVNDIFRANDTAYMVMEFVEGRTLKDYLISVGVMGVEQWKRYLYPLLDGMKHVHSKNLLHRDIKPENILLRRSDGAPVLIDFGAARSVTKGHTKSTFAVVTHGYSPMEQYGDSGIQGAWTDVYALAALSYEALFGQPPADAPARFSNPASTTEAVLLGREPEHVAFYEAVDWGLRIDGRQRPQTIASWWNALEATSEPRRKENSQIQLDPDEEAWMRALDINTGESFQAYLDEWPKGRHAKEANDRVEFAIAMGRNTVDALNDYLDLHPEGLYRTEAKSLITRIEDSQVEQDQYLAVRASTDLDVALAFLEQWPDGRFRAQVEEHISELEADAEMFAEAAAARDIGSLQKYLSYFPVGIHVMEAQSLLQELYDDEYSAGESTPEPNEFVPTTESFEEPPSTPDDREISHPFGEASSVVSDRTSESDATNDVSDPDVASFLKPSVVVADIQGEQGDQIPNEFEDLTPDQRGDGRKSQGVFPLVAALAVLVALGAVGFGARWAWKLPPFPILSPVSTPEPSPEPTHTPAPPNSMSAVTTSPEVLSTPAPLPSSTPTSTSSPTPSPSPSPSPSQSPTPSASPSPSPSSSASSNRSLDEALWLTVLETPGRAQLENYLSTFERGRHAEEARDRLAALSTSELQSAMKSSSPTSLNRYVNAWRNAKYIDTSADIKMAEATIEWLGVDRNNIDDVRTFGADRSWPEAIQKLASLRLTELEMIDAAAFNNAKASKDPRKIRAYVDASTSTSNRDSAMALVERAEQLEASIANGDKRAAGAYLKDFSNGVSAAAAQSLLAKTSFNHLQAFEENCPDCSDKVLPVMVALRAGRFQMGKTKGDKNTKPNESDPIQVSLPSFAIGRTEVTNAEWLACTRCNPNYASRRPGDADLPVLGMPLTEAEKYVGWLSAITGHAYSIPSEAQWEYAARAGTNTTALPKGTVMGAGGPTKVDNGGGVNGWGLAHMAGNALEMTSDCYSPDLRKYPKDGSPRRDANCDTIAARGGAYAQSSLHVRVANRLDISKDGSAWAGFRVVRKAEVE